MSIISMHPMNKGYQCYARRSERFDLGVIANNSLLWNEQIKTSVSKANQMIFWVVTNLANRDSNVMLANYKAPANTCFS